MFLNNISSDCVHLDTNAVEVVARGVEAGMWPAKFRPEGIKGNFVGYVKDKIKGFVRNKQKEKQVQERIIRFTSNIQNEAEMEFRKQRIAPDL